MTQRIQYRRDESRRSQKSVPLLRRRVAARVAGVIALMLGLAATAGAQTVLPIPFASTVAGIAPGSTACSSTMDIPTFNVSPGPYHYGDGCLATQATLSAPYSTAIDTLGNIYIGDYSHFELRVVYNGGTALAAAIVDANPSVSGLVPQVGHMYALVGGSRQGNISKTGSPSAYYCNSLGSGTVAIAANGDGCPGSEAYVKPRTPAVDKDGNIFFTSIAAGELVRVFYVQGAAAAALITLENPGVTPQPGFVYTIAGSATNGYSGDNPDPPNDTSAPGTIAKAAQIYSIRDVAVDANENVYVSDGNSTSSPPATNNNIRKITAATGAITTLAGSAGCPEMVTTSTGNGCPFGTTGASDGDGGPATGATTSTGATFDSPYALFLDANANVYVADYYNGRIRVIYQGTGSILGVNNPQTGYVYTVAGCTSNPATTTCISNTSGTPALQIAFALLAVAGIDPAGNLYAYDSTNRYLWRIDHITGIGTIIGGLGASGTAAAAGNYCAGTSGPKSLDTLGDGCPSTQTALSSSGRYSFDPQGNLYETESGNAVIRKFSFNTQFPATAVGASMTQPLAFLNVASAADYTAENFTLQGGTTTEFSDAGSDTCSLNTTIAANTTCVFNVQFAPKQAGLRPGSVAFTGSVASSFVSGTGNAPDTSIDPGTKTTIGAGLKPNGVGTDLLGNLYISDSLSNTVKKVAATGGTPATLISGLNNPAQVAVDGKGNVYVADTGNNRIAMTSSAGGAITSLGTGLSGLTGVAVDGLGNVYAADTGNNRVVKIFANGGQQTLPLLGLSALNAPSSLAVDSAGDLFVADSGNNRVVEFPVSAGAEAINLGTTTFTPTSVAVDAAGDLYITDATNKQVVSYLVGSTNGSQLISGLASPVGIAADVNGSLYVADPGLSFAAVSITAYSVTSNVVTVIANNNFIAGMSIAFSGLGSATFLNGQTLTVLATGLTSTQFQVAFTHANMSGADSGTATPQTPVGVVAVNRTLATVNYPFTNLGQTSPAAITFTDSGNLPLTFTGSQFATATGNTTQFSLTSASANTCVLGTPIAAGANCLITANFSPTAAGVYSETISPVTNAANNSSLSGVLSGQGVQLINTTTSISSSPPATSSIYYGQTVTVSSSTTLASNAGTPVGTITFNVSGTPQTPIAYGTGTASIMLSNLTVGPHPVSVSVVFNPINGVPVYASSGNSLTITVLPALTTTTLTVVPTTSGSAVGTQFTATISSATATGETGTVNFYSGSTSTTPLNPTPIVVSNGMAVYNTTAFSFPSNSFIAVYTVSSSNPNFAGSTSAVVQPAGDFNLTAASSSISIPQGGNTTNTIVVTPYFNYTGTVTPVCSGLPQYALCGYQPVSAAVNGAVTAANITAYSVSSNIVTLTAANNFVAGTTVTFTGLSSATFLNGQTLAVLSTGLSTTQFQVALPEVNGSGTDTGKASPVTPVRFTVYLYTNPSLTAQNREGAGTQLAWAMLSPIGLAALLFAGRRRLLPRKAMLAIVLAFSLFGLVALTACANSGPLTSGVTTPAGTQPVTVTFTDNNSPQVSHSVSFSFTVIANP